MSTASLGARWLALTVLALAFALLSGSGRALAQSSEESTRVDAPAGPLATPSVESSSDVAIEATPPPPPQSAPAVTPPPCALVPDLTVVLASAESRDAGLCLPVVDDACNAEEYRAEIEPGSSGFPLRLRSGEGLCMGRQDARRFVVAMTSAYALASASSLAVGVLSRSGERVGRFEVSRRAAIDAVALTDRVPDDDAASVEARTTFVGFGQWSSQLGRDTDRRLADFGRYLCIRSRDRVLGESLEIDPSQIRFLTRDSERTPVITFSGKLEDGAQVARLRRHHGDWFCAALSRSTTAVETIAMSVDFGAASRASELVAYHEGAELRSAQGTSNLLRAELAYFEWFGDIFMGGVAPRGTRAEVGYWVDAITGNARTRGSFFLPLLSGGVGLPGSIWVWADASLHVAFGMLQDGQSERLVAPTSALPAGSLQMDLSLSVGVSASGCTEILDLLTACGGFGLDLIGYSHLSGTNSSGGAVSTGTGYGLQPFVFFDVSTAFGF